MIAVTVLAAACADAPGPTSDDAEASPAPDVVELVCDRDGSASLSSPVVAARPDGVHLVVDNRLDEPVSVAGFDADPGVTRWTLSIAPGPFEVKCWPFSHHGDGEPPEGHTIEVRDPDGLYAAPPVLECPTDERSSTIIDFIDTAEGVSPDPIEAARASLHGLLESDELAVRTGGYPEGDHDGASVIVSRDGMIVAIVGVTRADDGRWLVAGIEACGAIDLG